MIFKKKQKELIPEGTHTCILWSIIDMGTQEGEWEGKKNSYEKVQFGWEFPSLMREFQDEDGSKIEKPMCKWVKYTKSLDSKANMPGVIQGIIGKGIEGETFEAKHLLGKKSLMQIVHEAKEGGGKKEVIASIMPIPDGVPMPEQFNTTRYFSIEDHEGETLPDWMQGFMKELIENSPEWQEKIAKPF